VRNKWFISAFIIALAIVSISMEQRTAPNQEIIITFSDTEANLSQSEHAIALVKNKLSSLEVDNIKVEQLDNGSLKVSYYSTIDVAEIKNKLSPTSSHTVYNLENDNSGIPGEDELGHYELDVYKIQDSTDMEGAAGVIVESKSESTRSSTVKVYASLHKISDCAATIQTQTAYNTHKRSDVAFINSFYNIPETRAGPFA
jgi:hypothetical protein